MTSSPHPGFRIFILGAGFSKPAGLPVATELYTLVRQHILDLHGRNTKFSRDVEGYLAYCTDCGISGQTEKSLDLELFMSYLDIEHYLGFRGSKTYSSEGNESQIMIRHAIGHVINARTPRADNLPDFYYQFADQLSVNDIVLTLNYDLVMEHALRVVGKPFRRFPYRYESVSENGGILDSDTEEVVLLKLHGSLDWFDDRHFLKLKEYMHSQRHPDKNLHSVFDDPQRYGARPLVSGLLPPGDALRHIHWIEHVDSYYNTDRGFNAPFILSPSHVKFVYAEPILSFWHGMGRIGGDNLGISVIGFSLPNHDDYVRIGLYKIFSNYGSWWDSSPMIDNEPKDYARFVDFRTTQEQHEDYRSRYRFVSTEQSRFYFEGFGAGAIDFLFNQRRKA